MQQQSKSQLYHQQIQRSYLVHYLVVKVQKPAVLATVAPYCEAYIPATLVKDLPMVLSELYKKEHLTLGYNSLLQLAKDTTLTVTAEQAKAAETKTRA